jgi:hypothetical protein
MEVGERVDSRHNEWHVANVYSVRVTEKPLVLYQFVELGLMHYRMLKYRMLYSTQLCMLINMEIK